MHEELFISEPDIISFPTTTSISSKLTDYKSLSNYSDYLTNQSIEFFKPLVRNSKMLHLRYECLSASLQTSIENATNNPYLLDEKQFIDKLIKALIALELLIVLNHRYLFNARDIKRYRKEQINLIKWLECVSDRSFSKQILRTPLFLNELLRQKITKSIWPRLFLIRLKSVLIDSLFLSSTKGCLSTINLIESIANPLLIYSGWLFHGGRLALTLTYLIQHVIPGFWMSEQEKQLGFLSRLECHLEQQAIHLINDSLWILSTIVPTSISLTLALHLLDIIIAAVQAFKEIRRLNDCLDEVSRKNGTENGNEANLTQQLILKGISYEQKKLLLKLTHIVGFAALAILKMTLPLIIPSLVFNPVFPLVMAALLLSITIATHLTNKWFETYKPVDRLAEFDESENKIKPLFSNRSTFFKTHTEHNKQITTFNESVVAISCI